MRDELYFLMTTTKLQFQSLSFIKLHSNIRFLLKWVLLPTIDLHKLYHMIELFINYLPKPFQKYDFLSIAILDDPYQLKTNHRLAHLLLLGSIRYKPSTSQRKSLIDFIILLLNYRSSTIVLVVCLKFNDLSRL